MQTGAEFAGGMQTAPQAPQLDVSFPVSTQDAPHVVMPPPQAPMHVSPWQTEPLAQIVAQAPQCVESELSSTHVPPQLL